MAKIYSENMRGAFFMATCMAAFGINDALIKSSSEHFTLIQTIFIRSIFTSVLLGILAWRQRAFRVGISSQDWKLIFLRMIGEIIGAYLFLYSIFNMPLANATAILQSMPLAITLGAALFLKEDVGWRRYVAVLIGFSGVLIIVRPGTEGFNSFSFFALGAVVLFVCRDLTTRRISKTIPSSMVSFVTSIGIMVTSASLLPFIDWRPVTVENISILMAASLFVIVGYVLSVSAMRTGDIGFVSPFRYTILLWSIVLGILVFGDIPDVWTIVGSAVVVITGIYTFYRERKRQADTETG
ncbi:MAG: DMT family transporter [Sneathiella sp.]|nr:DMT family transporter [Sneathiella sp.]